MRDQLDMWPQELPGGEVALDCGGRERLPKANLEAQRI